MQGSKVIEFAGPASYRIVVQGDLSAEWSDRLAGLTITRASREGAAVYTSLVGVIRDQAALAGVLETLYGLHLPIVRVEQVEDTRADMEDTEEEAPGED